MMTNFLHRILGRPGHRDVVVIMIVPVILLCVCGFIAVAIGVNSGATLGIDEQLLRAPRDANDPSKTLGPAWLEEVARDLTAAGGIATLSLVTAAVSGYLLICRKYGALALLLGATLGGLLLSTVLKDRFDRPRPAVVPHKSLVMTSSFPSGHSLNSAVVYLTLGTLLAGLCGERRLKFYFFSVALLLTLLVGISRVFMGVHFPTDVLAGWCAGLAWALLCGLVARRLRRRGLVERVDK
jgi:undecaprenyl-diphosphatase